MTLPATEIERVRPERRVSYTTVCSRRLYKQKHEALRLVAEAKAAREAAFWQEWEDLFMQEVERG